MFFQDHTREIVKGIRAVSDLYFLSRPALTKGDSIYNFACVRELEIDPGPVQVTIL